MNSNPNLKEVFTDTWEGGVKVSKKDKAIMKKKGIEHREEDSIPDSDIDSEESEVDDEEHSDENSDSSEEDSDDEEDGVFEEKENFRSRRQNPCVPHRLAHARHCHLLTHLVLVLLLPCPRGNPLRPSLHEKSCLSHCQTVTNLDGA